jgi:glycerol-3-phosphate acyltransferase PlsY
MLKGSVAVWLAAWLWGRQPALAAGLGAVLGHVFPLWLRFKGGKGVATYIGVLIALSWPVAAAFGGAWIAVAAVTRYSSLAGLIASALTPVLLWVIGARQEALLFAALTALVWIMHRANITRLLAGTEAKIGMKSAPPPPA